VGGAADIPMLRPPDPGRADPDAPAAAVDAAVEALADARAVTVVVNDPQRETATAAVLSRLTAGLPGRPLRALVACGSHAFDRAARAAFERKILAAIGLRQVAWHDDRSADLVEISPGGWRGHRWLIEEDHALLAVGSAEPHYFAGITGAHKTVTIGCASFDDIQDNHAGALSPAARPCRLAGNPVHEGVAAMVEALQARRPVHAIDLLQVGPGIVAASAGAPLEAVAALADRVRAVHACTLPAPADALVLRAEGVLARSFYQADKAIKNAEWAVRDGGCLVLVAACEEGIGQDAFCDLLARCGDYDAAAAEVDRRGYRLGDHKALRLRYLTGPRGVRAFVVSAGLDAGDAALLGLAKAPSVGAALAEAGVDPAGGGVFAVADAANTCVDVAAGGFDNPPADR